MSKKQVKKKKSKKVLTYAQAHNKALRSYQKSSRIMIWAGVFNIFGLMIDLIQNATQQISPATFIEGTLLGNSLSFSTYQYAFCFSSNSFLFRIFEMLTFYRLGDPSLDFVWFIVIIMAISLIFSSLAILAGIYASQGKKIAFYGQIIFYLVDTIMILACYLIGEASEYLWIMLGLHVIIWFFLIISIYEYYHLFAIEKIYKQNTAESDKITKVEENVDDKK